MAIECIDALTSGLSTLASRHFPSPYHYGKDGKLRPFADKITFAGVLDSAFNEIRQYAGNSVSVRIRLLEALLKIKTAATYQEYRKTILHHGELVKRSGLDNSSLDQADQNKIIECWQHLNTHDN